MTKDEVLNNRMYSYINKTIGERLTRTIGDLTEKEIAEVLEQIKLNHDKYFLGSDS